MNSTEFVFDMQKFTFGAIDYSVFGFMLCLSAGIGVYFGFCGKGADTTDEYLLGGKQMKTLPIAISLVASQLSGIAIMSIPAEMYSFGTQFSIGVPTMILITMNLCFVVIPVFYNNNISNCYEYLEMRFDKKTRQIVTVAFLITVYLIIPVIIFIPALAFSQVTGINIHLINGVVSCVCIFYTMLGGIKAVVWTDVVQAGIMFGSCILVATLGIYKIGGVGEVLQRAEDGDRLHWFNLDLDPTTRTTFWNCFLGTFFMWTGYVGLNQSCVQRIVALPSLRHAQISLGLFCVGFVVIMGLNCFTGVIMYARYYLCDPIKAGLVEKPDKLMSFFVQDILGHLKGLPGIFISCVFSAALSTMSANMNSLAGIVYFDYVRPFINHTEHKANLIMKAIVVVTGAYCVVSGLVVEKFSSILQVVITIAGVTQGSVLGVFILGMLYPRANAKAAFWSTVISMVVMAWLIGGAQFGIAKGDIFYEPLPTNLNNCTEFNMNFTAEAILLANTNVREETPFSIYKISFNWYVVIGGVLVWIIGVPLSHILSSDNKKLDPNLISPIAQFLIPKDLRLVPVSQEEDVKKIPDIKLITNS